MDGSTEADNKEQELVFVIFCHRDAVAQKISHTILNPATGSSEGLVNCLRSAFDERLDIDISQKDTVLNTESRPFLVGCGTDGASVNVGVHNGMKAQMQATLPWLFWSWCFSIG